MNENYIVINGKKVELTEEQAKRFGVEVGERGKRWRGREHEDYYYFVDTVFEVVHGLDTGMVGDDIRYYSHNYFQTQEEAEAYARVLETEMLLRKYADKYNKAYMYPKYYITWSGNSGALYIAQSPNKIGRSRIYFSTDTIAIEATKEVGEDRIKEYLTYEW